jgi:hypothetical protein
MTGIGQRFGGLFGRDGDSGTAAIEFALFAPFLLILIGGVTEIGFAMYEAMQVNAAVEAGLLYAAANGWDAASISDAVTGSSQLPKLYTLTATPAPTEFCGCPNETGSVENVGSPPCSTAACAEQTAAGTYVQVNATLNHLVILPPTWGIPANITATATIRVN